MIEPEEVRQEPFLVEARQPEPPQGMRAPGGESRSLPDKEPSFRAIGSPLPAGTGGRALQDQGTRTPPPQGRSLPGPANSDENGVQRAMSVLKQAMPFVHKLLPLIDGNVATVVANLFSARPQGSATPQTALDLTPVHSQITELQVQQEDLRTTVLEHNASLKRVADQLDMVREATDRNTLEQQELIDDLKAVGNKVNLFALLLFAMLLVSLILNLVLFLHIKQALP